MEAKLTKAEMALLAQAQAPNVYYETGLTPRELLERYREAVECLHRADAMFKIARRRLPNYFSSYDHEQIIGVIQKSKQQ